ncbi:MAG: YjgP/YjgQ family permease [Bacteroidetes bacterium]|nr:MAG: YjgP/YjgQ family permease [Bacteroidota bacterium]
MKKLDWYIIRKFLGTFFYAITLILLIVIIFDLSERIDNFIENQAPLNEILFVYYLNFIPYFANLFSPLFTFIAVIYFTSRMAFNTEIIAILNAGISFKRMLVPYFISAIFLAFVSVYLSNFLIPEANRKRIEFEEQYFRRQSQFRERNIHLQIRPGEFVYMESFNERINVGYKFTLERISDGQLTFKLFADRAEWIDSIQTWSFRNYHYREVDDLNEKLSRGSRMDTIIPLTPDDFIQNLREIEGLNFRELRDFIESERLRGSENIKFYQVEKHRRVAFPFATLVLTVIGVSLSSRKVRGGLGLHLGMGLTLSFAFILFMQVSTTFATNGNLPPAIAVWIPNIIFAALGAYLLKTAPK